MIIILIYIFIVIVSFLILKIIIIPYAKAAKIYLKYSKYSNFIFFPLLGYKKKFTDKPSIISMIKSKKPQQKFIVSNFVTKPLVAIHDYDMALEFLNFPQKYFFLDFNYLYKQLVTPKQFLDHQNWKKYKKVYSMALNFQAFIKLVPKIRQKLRQQIKKYKTGIPFKAYTQIFLINEWMASQTFTSSDLNAIKIGKIGLLEKLRQIGSHIFGTFMDPYFQFRDFLLKKESHKWGSFLTKKQKQILLQYRKLISQFQKIIQKRIKQIRQNQYKFIYQDTLDFFLKYYFCKQIQKQITIPQIIDQMMVFIGAATHLTAISTGNALYYLAKYPEWYNKIQKIAKQLPTNYTLIDINKYQQLNYFIRQVIRINSPAYFLATRTCKQNIKILDFEFQKNTQFTVLSSWIMFDSNNFEEPQDFLPQRYNGELYKVGRYPNFTFGGGPRNCVGQHSGILQIKVMLIEFVKKFRIKLNEQVQFKLVAHQFLKAQNEQFIILTQKQ